MELQKVENRRFGPGEKVELDGKSFVNCAFDGCAVVYGGQETFWDGVNWNNCQLTLVKTANYTVQDLRALKRIQSSAQRITPILSSEFLILRRIVALPVKRSAPQSAFFHRREKYRHENEHMNRGCDHAADDRCRNRFHGNKARDT